MPLNWNEIKERATIFSKEWENATSEDAEAKSFWDDLFQVFGVSRRRVASFEYKVPRENRSPGFIDLLWKGVLLVEHKSAGKDLSRAYTQAVDYFPGLKDHELPKYICVCNFQEFRLTDLEEGTEISFHLKDLVFHVHNFGFLAGYQKRVFNDQTPINIEAAYRMGLLHDELKQHQYSGHVLEVYLVRILFCLFAEDTTIFEKDWFNYFIVTKTREDGSDLGSQLAFLFQILDTSYDNRSRLLDEDMSHFPYVNGKLFSEVLPMASFNSKMRDLILDCSALDWSLISPAIFGSLFQSTMKPIERRNLGAHYTSERNILKVIKPLFLDELYEEFNIIKNNSRKLKEFHHKISKLKFLDPACGCGNFLVISYRELRILELEIMKIFQQGEQLAMNIDDLVLVSLDQFYGIEIEEWPCRIAEVAMWLIEHQMNMRMSEELGQYYVRLPLKKSAQIINANALRIDWNEVVLKEELSFILGNPPFIGSKLLNTEQRIIMAQIFKDVEDGKILDFVAAWYLIASKFIQNTLIKVCFVSTNSITQGEQVSVLWNELLIKYKIKIQFAHTTFRWNNEAKGVAAVHVVIVGFCNFNISKKTIFTYDKINVEPLAKVVQNINPYLVDTIDLVIKKSSKPICKVPKMNFGNMPLDGGNLLFTDEEKREFVKNEPESDLYFLRLISAHEFLNGKLRWCLWLENINPTELKKLKHVMDRVEKVRQFRLNSIAPSTQKHALTPSLFRDRNRPHTFIVIPRVSSENRKYIPIGIFNDEYIVSDTCLSIPDADNYIFGVLTSEMHMTWVKYTCGRLKSDFRYSKDLVYNNYPWPLEPSEKQIEKVKELAQTVLDTRLNYPDSSLADLYDPLSMPPDLVKAHQALDKAVDLCYRPQPFQNESARLEYLFELYQHYTAGMFKEEKKKRGKKNG